MKLTLIGYYGYGNFGDDIILASLLNRLDRMETVSRIRVLVREDTYSGARHFKLDKAHYLPTVRLKDKLNKYRYFLDTDLFVWGGGTCLYEPENRDIRGLKGFLRNTRLFRLLDKPYGFLGIGMGSLESRRARCITRTLLQQAAFGTFRDHKSLAMARRLTNSNRWNRLELCGDPFLLSEHWIKRLSKVRERRKLGKIAFCGHFSYAREDRMVAFYAAQMDRLIEELGVTVCCVPMQSSRTADDNRFHRRMAETVRNREQFHILTYDSTEELISIMEEMDFLIGMRLHAITLADVLGIPNAAVEYMPKVGFYLEPFNRLNLLRKYRLLESISPYDVTRINEAYWREKSFLGKILHNLVQEAERNLQVLETVLKQHAGLKS